LPLGAIYVKKPAKIIKIMIKRREIKEEKSVIFLYL
jgi:hypothetical protein